MTPKQLLIPRIKFIANYPGSVFKVGEIFTLNKIAPNGKYWHQFTELEPLHFEQDDERKYPAVIRLLEWWEERKSKEMPEYVKQTGMVDSHDNPIADKVLKVKKHFNAGTGEWRDDSYNIFCADLPFPFGTNLNYCNFVPATEADYNTFKSKSTTSC